MRIDVRLRWNATASATTNGLRKCIQKAFGLEVPENLQDIVRSSHCALIVYDMQAGIVPQISSGLEIQRQCVLLVNAARKAGWNVGKDRVERIWRREGLRVPQKQTPRGRLWLNDGSCVRLRPEHQNHVWSYDFVSTFTHDGRT